jgi:gas vesicle protein
MFEELVRSIALQVVPDVLKELLSILMEKLRQKWLGTPEDTTPTVEIKDEEIIEKIKEVLKKRDEVIQDDIKANTETMQQLIQQVLNEIKILSGRTSDLEVGTDKIGFSKPIQEEDKEFDPQTLDAKLEAKLKEIKTSLDINIAKRLTEIKKLSTSPNNEPPQSQMPEPSPIKEPSNEGGKQESPPSTEVTRPDLENVETPDSGDSSSRPQIPISNQGSNPGKKPVPENAESKRMLENLHKYKEYGKSILQELKSLEKEKSSQNEILDNAQLQDCLQSLEVAAKRTVELASSPVNIAIMGEFSSGKTLLVGSLIGYADALPVSEIPTTGNVTAIHLLQQDGFKTTEFDNFTVEYLQEEEVQECLNFMLGEVKKRAQTSSIPDLPQVTSNTLDQDTLSLYEQWCEEAWNQTQNSEIRSVLQELVIFIRAYVAYGAQLCGETIKINHTTAHKGLTLTSESKSKFEDIPLIAQLSVNKSRLTPELLQHSFSLIRRVNIHVRISKEIWNLGTTQDTANFILLDFPGLGAANSGVRDTFVSLQELEEVQTILILLNGRTPGSDDARKIFKMIEQRRPGQKLNDFILVGVGRFNQLPLEQELNSLMKNAANKPLTEKTVLDELKVLKSIIGEASAFTSQPDRIVLLDQLMGLADLAKALSSVKVGSEAFLAKLEDQNDNSIQESKRMRQKWQSLRDRLTDSQSSLGKQLGYFALDGGIGKLRELILNHVAAHSLKQLYEDARREVDELSEQQNHLKQILSDLGISLEESQALIDLRDSLRKMKSTYNRFKDNLGKEPLKNARGVAINDVIKDEVTYRMLEWRQWNLLFERAQNGRIELPVTTEDRDNPFGRKRKPINNIPTKSDDFYDEFQRTVNKLQSFARLKIEEAITNFLRDSSTQVSSEIEHLKIILREEMEAEIENKFDAEKADIFSVLYRGYNPEKWREYIMQQATQEEKSIDTEIIFPLARKDNKHESGQIFDWAPEYSQKNSQTSNQVLLVQRLRNEITASLSLHIIEYVSQINKKVYQAILTILNSLNPELDALLREDALLRYIAGEETEIDEADSVSPILSHIASIIP